MWTESGSATLSFESAGKPYRSPASLSHHRWRFPGGAIVRAKELKIVAGLHTEVLPWSKQSSIIYTSVDATLRKKQRLYEPYCLMISRLQVEDAYKLLFKDLGITRACTELLSRNAGISYGGSIVAGLHTEVLPWSKQSSIIYTSVDATLRKKQRLYEPYCLMISRLQVEDAYKLLFKDLGIIRASAELLSRNAGISHESPACLSYHQ
ncbi:hypothetical protein N7461_007028 [Penicillium sp. DV-2018c]|nr:hypothetical protein N7461_007028 [Penicillium sp. DV-2018c]